MNKKDVYKICEKCLKRFMAWQLLKLVFPIVPSLNLKVLVENASRKAFVDCIMRHIQKLDINEARRLVYDLMIMEVAVNSQRRQWHAFMTKSSQPSSQILTPETIRTKIISAVRKESTDAIVRTFCYDEAVWILIIFKNLIKGKLVLTKPVYMGYFLDENYIFIGAYNPTKLLLRVATSALGFDQIKPANLQGPCIKSLFTLLRRKQTRSSKEDVIYPRVPLVNDPTGKDFCQYENRKQYISAYMHNKRNIKLQAATLRVKAPVTAPGMEDLSLNLAVTIKSPNLAELIEAMAITGCIRTPLPPYIRAIYRNATNKLTQNKDVGEKNAKT